MTSDATGLVWYLGYGSNLSRDRFACYVHGGTPAGARRTYAGCRDRTPPRETVAMRVRGRLRFAGESTVWGGGLAFLDPDGVAQVHGRAYLLTEQQLADVAEQEPRYDTQSVVADREGVRVVALTSTQSGKAAAPSAAYLRTILTGLTDGLLDLDAAIAYLLRADGIGQIWDEPTIRALLEQPAWARG